ncbi:uncharacterized protein LOC134820725 [Bolinopsis microptera]|uniref:uncharacterized protein LOC134820725 n=1 Tax=Bolinopsis microptera TaxID=2820187 RepID=UPI003078F388
MAQPQVPDLSTELKPNMDTLKTSLHTLMKSAGVNFTQNSTVDSVTTKPGPEVAVPPFERSLEEFSHNCDAMLYELKQRRQALILAQYSMIMPCDPKMNYNQYKSLAKSHNGRVKELEGILTRLRSELSHDSDQSMGS